MVSSSSAADAAAVADDARNLMPATPANALSPGQRRTLPTARQASSIPMAPDEAEVPEHQKTTATGGEETAAAGKAPRGGGGGEALLQVSRPRSADAAGGWRLLQ